MFWFEFWFGFLDMSIFKLSVGVGYYRVVFRYGEDSEVLGNSMDFGVIVLVN